MNNIAARAGEEGLVRELKAWQILFIAIGGTIGLGFATTSGEVLAISGPGGLLIAFGIVGAVAICVMEGICEMIVLWPIPNAMIEFVAAFVDRDLAVIVGIAYWYTNAVTLAALIIGAANLLEYWHISFPLLNVVFVLFLFLVLIINSFGVKVFGWVELFGGIIKVLLVTTIFVIMMCVNAGSAGNMEPIGADFFTDGVRNNPNVAHSHIESVLMSIPLAIFSYIGVELVTVTAFEARTNRELQLPAKNIAYIICVIYMISLGGFTANIEWFNQNLPHFLSQDLVNVTSIADAALNQTLGHFPRNWQILPNLQGITAAPVVAAMEAGFATLPGALVGFIVYSGMSAANTALYVSSRTLYGLTRELRQDDDSVVKSSIAKLNTVSPKTRVPTWALWFSCFIFAGWLPFAHFQSNFTQKELQQTLVAIGSVSCVLVWASQCFAFIRYNQWLWIHQQNLRDNETSETMRRFDRWHPKGFSTYLVSLQPIPAYVGLISCLIIVFVLNSVSMYNGERLMLKALVTYLGPGILFLIFIILKIVRRKTPGWVKLGDWVQLRDTLLRLDGLIKGGRPRTPPGHNGNTVPQGNHNVPFEGPMPPPNAYGSNFQTNGYPHHAYLNGGVVHPVQHAVNSDIGFAMLPTAREIAERQAHAQVQGHNPQHQPSHHSLNSRSQSPNTGEPGYEMNEFGSPVSPVASEVHSDSMVPTPEQRHASMVSAMDERLAPAAPGPAYVEHEGYLDVGGYSRGEYRRAS